MEKNPKLPETFTSKGPWADAKNSIWPATLFLLRRNLDSHPFPSKLQPKQANEVLTLIGKPFSSFELIAANTLSPHQKELLFEHFILSEGFEKQDDGRAFIIDDSAKFLGLINLEDHLHLHTLSFESDFSNTWKSLSNLERSLSKQLAFAYSNRFGYLTTNPSVCGTGLVIQAFLHLPALLHLEKFKTLVETIPEEIAIKGLGKEGEYLADFILLENAFSLGVSEESILQSVQNMAQTLVNHETELRKNLSFSEITLLKDKIARSFGLISNAYTLEADEALSALSLIHLGKDLDWLTNGSSFHFFDLFFSCRRAHLTQTPTNKPINELRASYLREKTAGFDLSKLFTP